LSWRKARKKPVVVEFREVDGATELINTREGALVAELGKHYIIRGIEGEHYPIEIEVFKKTYDIVTGEETISVNVASDFERQSWVFEKLADILQDQKKPMMAIVARALADIVRGLAEVLQREST